MSAASTPPAISHIVVLVPPPEPVPDEGSVAAPAAPPAVVGVLNDVIDVPAAVGEPAALVAVPAAVVPLVVAVPETDVPVPDGVCPDALPTNANVMTARPKMTPSAPSNFLFKVTVSS
jgi:hypothetical protein